MLERARWTVQKGEVQHPVDSDAIGHVHSSLSH